MYVYFGFALLRCATFSNNQKYGKTKTNRKQNQNPSWLAREKFPAFRVIASIFDWTMDCPAFFVTGQSNYFGFGFTKLNWKLLYYKHQNKTEIVLIAIFRNMRTLLKSTVTTKVRFSLPSIIIIRQVTNLKKQKQTKWIEINQSQVTNVTFWPG